MLGPTDAIRRSDISKECCARCVSASALLVLYFLPFRAVPRECDYRTTAKVYRTNEPLLARRHAREGRAPCNHLVKHRAKTEDVGARIHLLSTRLLRRHIARR